METILIFTVFALAIVAIVALGHRVTGRVDETGAEVRTYPQASRKETSKKNSR